ncbi:hypothetical protein HY061_03390 [Candidatus Azambacteria bacterium]|nr:hypothetical protein [Candidatus Azambacteria bacterium]
MNKGSILLKILTMIGDRTIDFYDIFEGFVAAGYHTSLKGLEYQHDKRQWKRAKERREREDQRESKRYLQQYISRLKCDGLIERTENQVSLTLRGLDKLEKLKYNSYNQNFEIIESSNVIIISFDIPEKYRKNRNWLRGVLKFLNFEMIHQSTWMGKIKMPQKLLEQFEKKEILKYIKIFEVTKTGTLKELN